MNEEKESAKQTNKQKSLLEYKAEKAVRILEERIADIPDVQTWAKEAGWSRRWLCKSMKEVYEKSPQILIREKRFKKVVWLICDEGIQACCYSVAVEAGFKSETALSKFLSKYHETNFTSLKVNLLSEE